MTAVEVRCANCGGANPPGARFCSSCGAPLGEAAAPQEERKLVSVLFVDLVDSTARADKADPEDVRDVLALYHREAKSCIEQYGGVVEKFIGDAVLAVFGAPVGHGDDAERAVRAGLRALDERRPHLVTLLGPPGIGKSRLCHEVSAFVAESGGRVLRGRCLPYEEKTGYQAFTRVVYQAAGILESDPPDVARTKLESAVIELVPDDEATDTFRYLALLLGLGVDDNVPQGQLLFFAARRFIECVGDVQPTVFVFEDVHWADASELALLHYLAQHVRDAPVLLVAAARPELLDLHPTWGSGLAAQTTIPLEPLDAVAARTLAEHLAPAFDAVRLVDVAGGNPLFLEELAAAVAESGADEDLPVTVRETIAARIDAIPPGPRNALLAAAVIGKTFWRGILAAVGGADDIDEALNVLEARDLVRRDPSTQLVRDVQYTFKHMLIREVAYATVPRATRRERHAAVARYIEDALVTDSLSTILAYHWREAGERGKAIPYLLAAAEAARRSWAKTALIDLYTKALELA